MNAKAHSASRQGLALLVLVLVAAVFGAVSCHGPTGIEIPAKLKISALLNLGGADAEGYQIMLEPGPDGTVARPKQDPVRPGYNFGGWYADEACSEPFDFPRTIVTDTTVIYAKWDVVIRIVRFLYNYYDSPGEEYTWQEVLDGHYAVWPAPPSRPGHTFAGWFADAGGTAPFAFDQKVRGDKALYAKWGAPGTSYIHYSLNYAGGKINSRLEMNGRWLPGIGIRPGHVFVDWYETPECTGNPWTGGPLGENKILYAKWSAEGFTVTFAGNGGLPASSVKLLSYGEKVTPPQDPTRSGHRFTGWYTAPSGGELVNFDEHEPITSTYTFYARWKPFYTVALVRLSTKAAKSYLVEAGTAFTLPTAAELGTELGWSGTGALTWWEDSGHTQPYSEAAISPTADITLYGKFPGDIAQMNAAWTVTLVRLKTGAAKTYLVDKGTSLTLPAAAALGPGWSGTGALTWYRDSGHTEQCGPAITPTADTTLYGRFAEDGPKQYYTVMLVRLKTGQVAFEYVEAGTSFTLPPAGPGWDGTGALTWYENAAHTVQCASSITPAGDITLYGRFAGDIAKPVYTVTLLNLAQGKMKQYPVEEGASFALPPAGLGWTGTGALTWYRDSGHTEQCGPAISPTADTTLYGRFAGDAPSPAKQSYTVTLVRLATGSVKSYLREEGTIFTLPPADLGWSGTGALTWYRNAAHTQPYSASTITVTTYETLYGRFAGDVPKPTWTVTLFNLVQGKMKQYPVEQGASLALPPADLGWSGTGALTWYRSADHTDQYTGSRITPTADTTLYGRFAGDEPKQYYTVTLMRLSTNEVKTYTVEQGANLPLPSAAALGWIGKGALTWYEYANYTGQYNAIKITPVKDATLYGRFEGDIVKPAWTVTLLNLAQGKTKQYPVEQGKSLALPPAGLGWTGTGALTWYENAAHTQPYSASSITPAANTTLYGRFAGDVPPPAKQSYTVTLVRLATGSVKSYLREEGTIFTLPPAGLGWSGTGVLTWYEDSAHTQPYSASTIPVTGYVTLYGRFAGDVAKPTYTVTLVNLAQGKTEQYVVEEGESLTLPPASTLEWTGTGALSWYENAAHTQPYSASSITPAAHTMLYGRFAGDIPNPFYSATLVRPATNETRTYLVEAGTTLPLPSLSDLGWTGTGTFAWYRNGAYTQPYTAPGITPEAHTMLFGKFARDNYTMTDGSFNAVTLVLHGTEIRKTYLWTPNTIMTLPDAATVGWTVPPGKTLRWYDNIEYIGVRWMARTQISVNTTLMIYGVFE